MSDAHGAADGLRQACHDLRQPIAGVLALADAALAETGLPERARARLEQIIRLAQWQSDVIEHWLDAAGPGRPAETCTDVVRVINEAVAAERATWAGDLTIRWPAEPVFVRLHPVALRRVVANLLANATRAAGPAGMVTIGVGLRDGGMLMVVEDTGPGFGRVASGSGLGLREAARLAVKHRGRLECGGGRLGGGQVSLWLPLSPEGGRTGAACSV